MKTVLIATPSYDGRLDAWYANSLINTILLGLEKEIIFKPVFLSYDALIQRSRNDLVGIAVDNDFDGILWIDSDMEWNPQWAIDAVISGKDVFGLPVIKKSATQESYNIKCKIEDLKEDEYGLISVESVGTGFLYMSKEAVKHLWDNSDSYIHNEKDRRWVFEVKIQDGDIISEDVLVCQKLIKGGFKIFIDPSKTCNHIGSMKYVGDFKDFISRVKGLE